MSNRSIGCLSAETKSLIKTKFGEQASRTNLIFSEHYSIKNELSQWNCPMRKASLK